MLTASVTLVVTVEFCDVPRSAWGLTVDKPDDLNDAERVSFPDSLSWHVSLLCRQDGESPERPGVWASP